MSRYHIIQGDALANLLTMQSDQVHCIVTSPPYYGLRDYGIDGQIGLESTIEEYVANLVKVFEECQRVLRDDGTLWLNLGDSYATNRDYQVNGTKQVPDSQPRHGSKVPTSLKSKDLIGIPWRVAFALQATGWWLRSDIIWAKRAPMPESVTDRPTRSHEHIFLLSKSERYYYDQVAVREPSTGQNGSAADFARETKDIVAPGQSAKQHRTDRTPTTDNGYRNQRDVWIVGPEPYPEAHFATFPTEIPRRAILAGTSARGCCSLCGAPWLREVERKAMVIDRSFNHPAELRTRTSGTMLEPPSVTTVGWRPTCDCPPAEPIPCTVLDPFLGSGTTLAVARSLGRDGIGIELNPDYIELAHRRIDAVPPRQTEMFV